MPFSFVPFQKKHTVGFFFFRDSNKTGAAILGVVPSGKRIPLEAISFFQCNLPLAALLECGGLASHFFVTVSRVASPCCRIAVEIRRPSYFAFFFFTGSFGGNFHSHSIFLGRTYCFCFVLFCFFHGLYMKRKDQRKGIRKASFL